jgi:hypothetical protein
VSEAGKPNQPGVLLAFVLVEVACHVLWRTRAYPNVLWMGEVWRHFQASWIETLHAEEVSQQEDVSGAGNWLCELLVFVVVRGEFHVLPLVLPLFSLEDWAFLEVLHPIWEPQGD